jgi:hypothetical protein
MENFNRERLKMETNKNEEIFTEELKIINDHAARIGEIGAIIEIFQELSFELDDLEELKINIEKIKCECKSALPLIENIIRQIKD